MYNRCSHNTAAQHNNLMVTTNMVNTIMELSSKSNWVGNNNNPKVNNAILSLYCLGQASKKQLSGKLLDTFHDWNLSEEGAQKYEELEEISAYLEVIEGLGWLEHTGDWDPALVIGTNNGDTLTFENGYWQFHLLDDEDGARASLLASDHGVEKREEHIAPARMFAHRAPPGSVM